MLHINLLTRVSCENAVVLSTVCKVSKGVQDVIVETTDCVMVLDDFIGIVAKETWMGLVPWRLLLGKTKITQKHENCIKELATNKIRIVGIFINISRRLFFDISQHDLPSRITQSLILSLVALNFKMHREYVLYAFLKLFSTAIRVSSTSIIPGHSKVQIFGWKIPVANKTAKPPWSSFTEAPKSLCSIGKHVSQHSLLA